jgi:hypothetical protein
VQYACNELAHATAATRFKTWRRKVSCMGIQEFVNKKLVRDASIDAPA